MNNKEKVVALLQSIQTGDQKAIAYIHPQKYIQHNLFVADGVQGFSEFLKRRIPNEVNIVRVFQDGDFVFAHTLSGTKIELHIFRFEDGYMVEHWDNFQQVITPTKNGHSMIDGPTQARDLDKTDDNKKLIKKFFDDILYANNIKNITTYISTEKYVQHNPNVADGLVGFNTAMEELEKAGLKMEYKKTYKILGEGDFVLTQSEGELAGKDVTFYDLWRIENGKITEHWDVIEPMLPKEKWKNQNGKF